MPSCNLKIPVVFAGPELTQDASGRVVACPYRARWRRCARRGQGCKQLFVVVSESRSLLLRHGVTYQLSLSLVSLIWSGMAVLLPKTMQGIEPTSQTRLRDN